MTKTIELPNNITITFATNGDLVSYAKKYVKLCDSIIDEAAEELGFAEMTYEEVYLEEKIDYWRAKQAFWLQFLSK